MRFRPYLLLKPQRQTDLEQRENILCILCRSSSQSKKEAGGHKVIRSSVLCKIAYEHGVVKRENNGGSWQKLQIRIMNILLLRS